MSVFTQDATNSGDLPSFHCMPYSPLPFYSM